ncbi:protein of unknown function DUF1223 (plasmid) [Rhizobium leguminosarum bv. trifolii WSM1325]|uniref:DUF1223 domain-containing protein n=1 Tax=Rhizobium leguminosarum bv. trifolii (strain WSM1325) TaxID=395491 RepID=C6B8M1_RHILS|nr:DUF1223 domain-containing protein [Rhizobium leguminosarum]ACS60259.1 protein of unknown function DUF1223 [Rhizobium leguminosarum bv. trifolii WSM1325]
MKRSKAVSIASHVVLAVIGLSGSASAADRPLTVVELFTSQGCSSCPPANANLIKLSKRDDVLTLSFAVTYWDYLGWKDSFGKREFTDRQAVYEPALGQSGSYTPQMVVNGRTTTVGNNLAEIKQLVSQASPLTSPSLTVGKSAVAIGSGRTPDVIADIWLVSYDPNLVEVPVARGENSGETLPHIHVVHDLTRLGGWNGKAVSYNFTPVSGRLKTAILVQGARGGAILSAATD